MEPSTTQTGLLFRCRSLNAGQCLVGDQARVLHAGVGVELHPLGHAPLGEIVRVNVYADDPQSFDLLGFAAGFGCAQPLIVGPMEFVTVLEHGPQADKVLGLEPGHTDDLYLSSHAMPSDAIDEHCIVAEGCAASDPQLQAMARRALIGLLADGLDASRPFWLGYAKALISLADGTASKLAERDARLAAQDAQAGFAGAWSRLTVGIEALSCVEVQERFATQGVEVSLDAAATFQINAVKHLEQNVLTVVNGDEYVTALAVYLNNGAGLSHLASVTRGVQK